MSIHDFKIVLPGDRSPVVKYPYSGSNRLTDAMKSRRSGGKRMASLPLTKFGSLLYCFCCRCEKGCYPLLLAAGGCEVQGNRSFEENGSFQSSIHQAADRKITFLEKRVNFNAVAFVKVPGVGGSFPVLFSGPPIGRNSEANILFKKEGRAGECTGMAAVLPAKTAGSAFNPVTDKV